MKPLRGTYFKKWAYLKVLPEQPIIPIMPQTLRINRLPAERFGTFPK